MDFTNLTFDELLDAIRSDSGYQTAQAKKEYKEENVSPPVYEFAETPIQAFSQDSDPEESTSIDELAYKPGANYYGEDERFSEAEPVYNPSANYYGEDVQFSEDSTVKIEEEYFDGNSFDEYVQPSKPQPIVAEEVSDSSDKAEDVPAKNCEPAEVEKIEFSEPVSVLPDVQSLFEIVEEIEEEPAIWKNPLSVSGIYSSQPVAEKEQGTACAESAPSSDPSVQPEEQLPKVFYRADAVPEPIEVVYTEDEDEEESEPIKIYTPPTGNPTDFGGFNINMDVSSLFYATVEENSVEETPADITDEKTRTISSVPFCPPREAEKTKVINPASESTDSKTRVVDISPVFERPGIVTTSSSYDKTSDLNAMPHILPADEFIGGEAKKFVRTGEIPKIDSQPKTPVVRHEEDEQMVLPGFFELEEVVRVNEAEVEEELRRTRSRKVDSFRLEGADIEEPAMDEDVSRELQQGNTESKKRRFSRTKTRHRLAEQRVEFTRPADGKNVHRYIKNKKILSVISAAITACCGFVLMLTTAIPFIADKINSLSGGVPITYVISLVFLLIAIGAAMPTCFFGITCFFKGAGRPNAQTPVIVAALVALIHNIVAISAYDGDVYPLFSLAAIFLMCCCSIGNLLIYARTKSNFAFLFRQGKEGLYSVRAIDNAIDANRVSQNVVMGDADIRYSGKLKFATRFMSYSLSSNSTDDLCAKLVPISLAISIVIGVITGIVTKSFMSGMTVFCGALCMGSPVCALIAANLPLLIENKRMNADGAMITSYAAAYEYESTNAIALDASDLFPGENCNIHGMKTFNGLRMDDAVLTAASMLIAAGGPISSLFENVIMDHNELLLKVEDLKYEERLGLSGWIRDRRIFVGNRKLLENHNIEIPMSVDESKYVHGDRQIIYLADAGKIAAFFVVSYGRNKKIAEYLRRIENNGINILVRTTDSNINEKFIAKCFDIPLNSVKVVSNTAGEVLKNHSEHVIPREDAKLIHNGTATAFLHAVSSASKLCATAGKISTLQTFCMATGLLLTVLIMIFSDPLSLTALSVCLCQSLWMAIAAILPLFGKE